MRKHQVASALEKRTLIVEEKVKFLDYAEANQKLGCRKFSEVSEIWKTTEASILKSKRKYIKSTSSFIRKTKNAFDLENTSLSMTFYMIDTKNVAFPTSI